MSSEDRLHRSADNIRITDYYLKDAHSNVALQAAGLTMGQVATFISVRKELLAKKENRTEAEEKHLLLSKVFMEHIIPEQAAQEDSGIVAGQLVNFGKAVTAPDQSKERDRLEAELERKRREAEAERQT